jgi:hypothetical protein
MARTKKVKGISLPKHYSLNGKKYQFKWSKMRNNLGLCADPESSPEDRIISINPTSDRDTIISTIIHECLHAEMFIIDEETIDRAADEIFNLLKSCGAISQP